MAAVSVSPASRPNPTMPSARRKACRRRSRSSCISTVNSSRRFSPMVNSRRAKVFEVVASCRKLRVDVSMTKSVALAGAATRDKKSDEHADADADGDGLIGIFADGLVGDLRAGDGFIADICGDFLAAFERGGEAVAGFTDFLSGHVCGGGHQRARVFGK